MILSQISTIQMLSDVNDVIKGLDHYDWNFDKALITGYVSLFLF